LIVGIVEDFTLVLAPLRKGEGNADHRVQTTNALSHRTSVTPRTRAEKHSTHAAAPGYFAGCQNTGLPRTLPAANVQLDIVQLEIFPGQNRARRPVGRDGPIRASHDNVKLDANWPVQSLTIGAAERPRLA
jgi:hypothetical protein